MAVNVAQKSTSDQVFNNICQHLERRYNALARNTMRLKEWLDWAATAFKNALKLQSIPSISEAALWEAIKECAGELPPPANSVAAVGFTALETAGDASGAKAANDFLTWEANDFSWVIANLGNKLVDRLQDCDEQRTNVVEWFERKAPRNWVAGTLVKEDFDVVAAKYPMIYDIGAPTSESIKPMEESLWKWYVRNNVVLDKQMVLAQGSSGAVYGSTSLYFLRKGLDQPQIEYLLGRFTGGSHVGELLESWGAKITVVYASAPDTYSARIGALP